MIDSRQMTGGEEGVKDRKEKEEEGRMGERKKKERKRA
jgi:hypothetical protein